MADKNNFYPLLNSQFTIFDELFNEYEWKLNENHIDRVVYLKPGCELDTFEIKVDSDSIYVSAPIRNCDFLYRAKFSDFISAFDYVERRVLELNSTSS
jgi:hypothetical protein